MAIAALEPLVAASAPHELATCFKDTSRALLASHLIPAASWARDNAGDDEMVYGHKVLTWLLMDDVEACHSALSDTCAVLQELSLSSMLAVHAVGGSALDSPAIVDAVSQFLVKTGKDKRSKDKSARTSETPADDASENGAGGWGRCVRACALLGGVVTALSQHEAAARQSQRRGAGGSQDSEAKTWSDGMTVSKMADLVKEVEEHVVAAWKEQEQRGLSGLQRALCLALGAHVLKFHALSRALDAGKGPAAGEHAVVKEVGGMLSYCLRVLGGCSRGTTASRPGVGAKGRAGRQAGLVNECCSHFVVSVCSCLGRLKPQLTVDAYNLLLALLLVPDLRMDEARRMACFKALLLNSSRDHIALVCLPCLPLLAPHLLPTRMQCHVRACARARTYFLMLTASGQKRRRHASRNH
jgi:hypothetical protein